MSLPAALSAHRIGVTARALFSILPSGLGLVVLATLLLPGCSKNKTSTAPTTIFSLTGRVRLIGHLTDANGDLTGQRVIDDADGVRVYLVNSGAIVDSAITRDGVFGFRVALGTYFAFAGVTQGTADTTEQLHVHDADRVFPDTIGLVSAATLKEYPNPFSGSLRSRFSIPTAGDVRLEVRALGGSSVRTLVARPLPAGYHEVLWDGLDDAGHSAPIGLYWMVLDKTTNLHEAALLFREGFALSGRVSLTWNLADEVGTPTGRLVITEADGVRVRLSKPDGSSDSTLTRAGRYEFGVTQTGTYRAAAYVVPAAPVSTPGVMVSGADVSVSDTLKLGPAGELKTYPNPFPSAHGLAIEFNLDHDQTYTILVTGLDGSAVWTYSGPGVQGLNHIHWLDAGLPNGGYWVVVKSETQERYNLAFKQ